MSSFGVTDQGFANLRQSDWLADLQAAMAAQFGTSVSYGPDSVLGQLCAIMSERMALLSEAAADTYASQDPQTAEGLAVDYILALSGLSRLGAKPTTTNPVPVTQTNGIVLPGLVLYGTPGTTIPAGAIVQTTTLPTLNFTLDAAVTIAVAQNGVQQLVFGQKPTSGSYTVTLTAPSGALLGTPSLPYAAAAADVQAAIVALADTDGSLPFTDVAVSSIGTQVLQVAFGANTPAKNQPASGARAQAKMTVATQALVAGSQLVNLSVTQSVVGSPAQGTGSATCTASGPNAVTAGQLSVIGSAQSGWTGVNNPLDCVSGRNVESDTDALARRLTQLAARGRGTLVGLATEVRGVPNVTAALAFENTTQAAQQVLAFSATPTGPFQLVLGGRTTASIAAPPTAASIQAAINACSGLDVVRVAGSLAYGFAIDFNGAQGGQPQPAIAIINDQTGVSVTQAFGRPPKSFEVVVQGGDSQAIAQAILAAAPAGIAAYGTPTLRTTGSVTAGSPVVNIASVTGLAVGQSLSGLGLQQGALVAAISGTQATLSLPALGTYANTPIVAQTAITLIDDQQNPHIVAFSRPTAILVYVSCALVTDYFNVPGNPQSGQNPQAQFSPASMADVQADLMAAAAAVPIGGILLARGTEGLAGSFRNIPGVIDYTLTLDTQPNPTQSQNIALLTEQVFDVEQGNFQVSFS